MPKTKSQYRKPTYDDLDEEQQQIYHALPQGLRETYLIRLPEILVESPSIAKARKSISNRIGLLATIRQTLREDEDRLQQLLEHVEAGARVDLRIVLAPPTLNGAVIRFMKSKNESRQETETQTTASDEKPRRRRGRPPKVQPETTNGTEPEPEAVAV